MDERDKNCYCFNCDRNFHYLGIASHRATHRRLSEDCKIYYGDGRTVIHTFSERRRLNG